MDKFFQSKKFKIVFMTLSVIIILLSVFKVGEFIGFKKANFSYRWGENYHRNFGGPRRGFFEDFSSRDLIDAYGTFGQIIKISSSTIVVLGRGDVEKIISIQDNTIIKRFRDNIRVNNLKINDRIVVIGNPNNSGQIEAKLIRVLPLNPTGTSSPPFPPQMRRR